MFAKDMIILANHNVMLLALKLLHSSGWVHHDVSSGNILLEHDGNVRLADFEYAKRMGTGDESRVVRTLFTQ